MKKYKAVTHWQFQGLGEGSAISSVKNTRVNSDLHRDIELALALGLADQSSGSSTFWVSKTGNPVGRTNARGLIALWLSTVQINAFWNHVNLWEKAFLFLFGSTLLWVLNSKQTFSVKCVLLFLPVVWYNLDLSLYPEFEATALLPFLLWAVYMARSVHRGDLPLFTTWRESSIL